MHLRSRSEGRGDTTTSRVWAEMTLPWQPTLARHFQVETNTDARIDLINRFIHHFGKQSIAGLLYDREFVGKRWFQYLKSYQIVFYIRIKNNRVTTSSI